MENHVKYIISDIPIYWINLDRSIDRRERLEKIFIENELNNKRIQAVDGKNIDIDNIKKNYTIKRIYSKQLRSAIGCTLSHIKAIKEAYDDNLENVIIMEDDCNFEYLKYKKFTLNEIMKIKDDWEIIQLSSISRNKINIELGKYKNDLAKMSCWGTAAYLINKNGMKNVLENFEKKKEILVSDLLIYGYANTYVSIPYFTYHFTKDIQSNIREYSEKKIPFPDRSKIFWDNYFTKK
jgi:GR25 family glycosyltransferase involved in LPS biosynthesis